MAVDINDRVHDRWATGMGYIVVVGRKSLEYGRKMESCFFSFLVAGRGQRDGDRPRSLGGESGE